MGRQDNGRDAQGRFKKGVSGNPGGRPRKQVPVPKDMRFMLAEELEREVVFTDAAGHQRRGTQYEMIGARIVSEAAKGSAKEALAILERLDKLGAINLMRVFLELDPELVVGVARGILKRDEVAKDRAKMIDDARGQSDEMDEFLDMVEGLL